MSRPAAAPLAAAPAPARAVVEVRTMPGVTAAVPPRLGAALPRFGRRALERLQCPVEVSVLLCDASTMRQLNARYRGLDRVTDVLSFGQREGTELPTRGADTDLAGDVAIAVDVAGRQAAARGEPLERELCRLLLHGMLHLIGMDHADPPAADEPMLDVQERLLGELHPLAATGPFVPQSREKRT